MKNLDLNQLGVQEMSNFEFHEIEGGRWSWLVEKAIEGLIYCAMETHNRGTLADAPQGVWLWQ